MTEQRHYLWLRFAVLGFAALVLGTLTTLMVFAVSGVWPYLHPITLDCGCAVSLTPPSLWTWFWTAGLTALTIGLWARFSLWVAKYFRRMSRLQSTLKQASRIMTHQSTHIAYVLIDEEKPMALTLGWWRPQVFMSRGLIQQLSPSEVTAVLRHEQAHQQQRDPLWAAVVESIGATFAWVPWLRSWIAASYSYRELVADAMATDNYHHTAGLSGAIVKLLSTETVGPVPAFSPNTDRVEKLLNPAWQPVYHLWHRSYGLMLGLVLAGLIGAVAVTRATAVEPPQPIAGSCQQTIQACTLLPEHISTMTVCSASGQCLRILQSRPYVPWIEPQ